MQLNEDLLSKIIDPLRLESAFVSFWKMAGDWSFAGPDEPCALFHYIARGHILIAIEDKSPIALNQGDIAIFPRGNAHRIGSTTTAIATPLEDILPRRSKGKFVRIEMPGEHRTSAILCAGLHHGDYSAAFLYKLFPQIIIIRKDEIEAEPLLHGTIQGLLREVESSQEGKNFVLHRGLELIYVLGLRVALDIKSERAPRSYALRDHRIVNALLYIHTNYRERLSVTQIAASASMSRSAFSLAFRQATGYSPAFYLSRVRISEAQKLLRTTRLTREEIAYQVGFKSAVGLYLALRSALGKKKSNTDGASSQPLAFEVTSDSTIN